MTLNTILKKTFWLWLFSYGFSFGQTTFYFSSTAPAVSPPTNLTAWSQTASGGVTYGSLTFTKNDGTAVGTLSDQTYGTNTKDSVLLGIFVSEPLKAMGAIGGSDFAFGQFRGLETFTNDNASLAFALVVTTNSGDSVRGVLFNTSAPDAAANEFSATTLTNRKVLTGTETVPTCNTVTVEQGDRLVAYVGFREVDVDGDGVGSVSITNNSATDLPNDETTTSADNSNFGMLENFDGISGEHTPLQPPQGCNMQPGDTLYPFADGDSIGLSAGSTPHADLLDEAPNSGGCGSANDSVWNKANAANRDYFYLRTLRGDSTWGTFRGARSNDQIDCIAIVACLSRASGFGASRDGFVQLGIMDSSSGSRFYYTGPEWDLQRVSTRQTYTLYIPNKPSATEVLGDVRWDSASLANLQLRIKLRCTNANDQLSLFNLYVLVYASSRDTSIADSTSSDMQVLALGAAGTLQMNRQSAFFESNQNKGRVWLGTLNTGATEWLMTASDDTGRTWTYLDQGGSDTTTIRDATDGLGVTGIYLFGSKDASADSFRIGGLEPATLDTGIIYLTKRNQTARADLSARTDLITVPTNGTVAIQYPCFYQLADTIWSFGGTNTTAGFLRWQRSTDNGQTWGDSGYIQGIASADTSKGASVEDTIQTTGNSRRLAVVRWTNGYPALFSMGWRKGSAKRSGVRFQYWHPEVTNADSMRCHAWLRANGTTTCDTLLLNTQTGNDNGGELAATSMYSGGNPVAYCTYVRGNQLKYARINNSLGIDTGIVAEISLPRTLAIPTNLTMASKDTLVYAFFNYMSTTSSSDSQNIYFSMYCGGGWRGPRKASWANGIKVQHRYPSTSPYQYGNMVGVGWLTTTRLGATFQEVYYNRIVKPSNPAAGGAPPPLRRRRLIIEKNYKTGALDEKEDSVPDWAGLRLPDFDDTEK